MISARNNIKLLRPNTLQRNVTSRAQDGIRRPIPIAVDEAARKVESVLWTRQDERRC